MKFKLKIKKKKSKYKSESDRKKSQPIPIDPEPREGPPEPLDLAKRAGPREWDDSAPEDDSERVKLTLERKTRLPVFNGPPVNTDAEMRKMNLTPGVHCSVCVIGTECPEFREGAACAYTDIFRAFPSRSVESVLEAMRAIMDKNKERLLRAYHHEEQVNGGMLDSNVTRQSEVVMRQLEKFMELDREHNKATLETSNTKKDGIFAKLFGGGQQSLSENSGTQVIETEVVEKEVKK